MLSIFPELFNYSFVAIFVLRFTLGLLLISYGLIKISKRPEKKWKVIGVIELIVGILLSVGLFTQLASLIVALLMFGALVLKIKKSDSFAEKPFSLYVLLFVISLSLLFLGPGIFAIDLPL